MRRLLQSLSAAIVLMAAGSTAGAALTAIGPLPYLSAADSPFLSNPSLTMVLEDFEDGLLNVPGIVNEPLDDFNIPPNGTDGLGVVLSPGPETDSVDADDGVIDGSGVDGYSLRSTRFNNTVLDGRVGMGLGFSFSPVDDRFPTAFGFAWTDGEPESTINIAVLERDRMDYQLLEFSPMFGEQSSGGETANDKFVGFTSSVGIKAVVIGSGYRLRLGDSNAGRRLFFEVDHLQFALARIPEPNSSAIFLIGMAIALRNTRDRK